MPMVYSKILNNNNLRINKFFYQFLALYQYCNVNKNEITTALLLSHERDCKISIIANIIDTHVKIIAAYIKKITIFKNGSFPKEGKNEG